jgi:hypothetical protein
MAKGAPKPIPDRKISETLLHFAEPVLHDLPSEAPEIRARQALVICFTVWNAVIFADVLDNPQHLDHVRRLTPGRPQAVILTEQLIARKRALFADDERLIGNWEVTRTADGINLWAEARDPHSIP